MDNCKNAKFCVPTITIEIRNIETIDKSPPIKFHVSVCPPKKIILVLPNKKSWKNGKNYQFLGWKNGRIHPFLGWKNGTILHNIKSINYLEPIEKVG